MIRPPPRSTLFPNPTFFRSRAATPGARGRVGLPPAVQGRDAAPPPRRQRRTPARVLRGQLKHRACPGRLPQQRAPVLEGVLLRRGGELVDEALDHEGVVRDTDTAPETRVHHGLLVAHVLDLDRRDVVE